MHILVVCIVKCTLVNSQQNAVRNENLCSGWNLSQWLHLPQAAGPWSGGTNCQVPVAQEVLHAACLFFFFFSFFFSASSSLHYIIYFSILYCNLLTTVKFLFDFEWNYEGLLIVTLIFQVFCTCFTGTEPLSGVCCEDRSSEASQFDSGTGYLFLKWS